MVACRPNIIAPARPGARGWSCRSPVAKLAARRRAGCGQRPTSRANDANQGETTMPTVTWDHIHLRSPDPEATAAWLVDILGGEIVRGPGGSTSSSAAPMCSSRRSPPVTASTRRRDAVSGARSFRIDGAGHRCGGRRDQGQGRRVTKEPTTIRPGVRICFIRGPQASRSNC